MEKERGSKVLAIIALVVGLVGLSLGFASFSRDLEIREIAGNVTHADNFNVHFVDSTVTPSLTGGATAGNIVLENDATYIQNITASFTKKADKVQYTFSVKNDATYDAYLNDVIFGKATPTCTAKTAGEGVNVPSVDVSTICGSLMKMTVTVGGVEFEGTDEVSNHVLGAGQTETVIVALEYLGTAPDVDGDFEVDFGSVVLGYDSIEQ